MNNNWTYIGLIENLNKTMDYFTIKKLEQEHGVINKGGIFLAKTDKIDSLKEKYSTMDSTCFRSFTDFYGTIFHDDWFEYIVNHIKNWQVVDYDFLFDKLCTRFDCMSEKDLLKTDFQKEIVKEAKFISESIGYVQARIH